MQTIVLISLVVYLLTIALYVVSSISKEDKPPFYPIYIAGIESLMVSISFILCSWCDGTLPESLLKWIVLIAGVLVFGVLGIGLLFLIGLSVGYVTLAAVAILKFLCEPLLGHEVTFSKVDSYLDPHSKKYKTRWCVISAINIIAFLAIVIKLQLFHL